MSFAPRVTVFLWIFVFVVAGAFRFIDLPAAPLHADEAVGARITGDRLEGGKYHFDPSHYHGPSLSWLGAQAVRLAGQKSFAELDVFSLRSISAVCGLLVILLPLILRKWLGDAGALLAGALLATSPLLCQFSRVFIHEPVLSVFSACAIVGLSWWLAGGGLPAALCGGLALGLMAATKETFGIMAISWLVGLVACKGVTPIRNVGFAAISSGLVFLAVLIIAYGSPWDFFKTYFVYSIDPGHHKPWDYYWHLLLVPKHNAPQWWTEAGVGLLAVAGAWSAWRTKNLFLKWLAVSTAVQFAILSAISYKTPWLATVPWIQSCLLAGTGAAALLTRAGVVRLSAAVAVLSVILFFQVWQTGAAVFRFSNDPRNPMAYSLTSRDIVMLGERMRALHRKSPAFRAGRIAVLGKGYWPLPWYLRGTSQAGYFDAPPSDLENYPVVIALPEAALEATSRLSGTHEIFYNGLRSEVPLSVFVRQDVRAEEVSIP
jgi:uncharacterized protein (TIGR03663 family)